MRRRRTSLIGAVLASLTVLAVPSVGVAAPSPPSTGIEWHPCEQAEEVECATIPVPVDWSKPQGETIDLAVARRKATNPDQRIGSLVYMPGGPGGSGVSSLIGGVGFSKEITSKFDIVSFDPRGIARSNAVECDSELLKNPPELIPDGSDKQFKETVAYNEALGDSCREHSGALLDNMDSVSTARDIDAFREALGENRLSLYGISYGTLAGQMYAENFPNRVRALLLDSTMDHSLGTREFMTTEAAAAEDSFIEFGKWCGRTPECKLHGADVGKVFDRLYERAERGQLHVPGRPDTPLKPMELGSMVIGAGYGPSFQQLSEQLATLDNQSVATREPASPETLPNPAGAFCGDYRMKIRSAEEYAGLWRAHSEAAPHVRASVGWPAGVSCANWPAKTGNPQHELKIKDTPPILVMNARHDPATPLQWAKGVDRQVDAATLLTYEGWGHGVYDRSECTTTAADRYLVDLAVPKGDPSCPAVPPSNSSGSRMIEPPERLTW